MKEKQTDKEHDADYDCYHHGWGGYHKFIFLRIMLMLFLLTIVFGVGVKIGEFKAELRYMWFDSYSYGHPAKGMRYFTAPMAPGMFQYRVSTSTPK